MQTFNHHFECVCSGKSSSCRPSSVDAFLTVLEIKVIPFNGCLGLDRNPTISTGGAVCLTIRSGCTLSAQELVEVFYVELS